MTINYNTTGADRKKLVAAIAEITGVPSKYLGAPTFAYQVDYFTIDRNGSVTFDDRADSEEIEDLIERLDRMGFTAEPVETEEDAASEDDGRLTIQLPAADFTPEAVSNLNSLLAAKGRLIRKAIGAEALPVEVGPDTISFPWFGSEATGEEVKAYTHLVTALCDMARNQKRITAREKATDNDKYAFRCFLLRLGFIGAEFKEERKILLRNLSGNSAFKSGKRNAAPLQPEAPDPAMRVAFQGDPELAEALADELLLQQVNASFGEEAAS